MLRTAQTEDFEFIFGLFMHEKINPFISYDPMRRDRFEPIFTNLLTEVDFRIFEEGGDVLGMVQIDRGTHRFRHSAHLGGIAIVPEHQDEGKGTQLMMEVIEELRAEGIVRLELCVSADNPSGIAFYEKLGFEREGTMKQYFSRAGRDGFFDEHIMAKFISHE